MRSLERIDDLGEVFTPRRIVIHMLRLVPVEIWADPTNEVLDPTCGDGAFLVCVIYLKIKAGLTPLQALQTTFGVDLSPKNVHDCRDRMLKYAEKASGQQRTNEWVHAILKNVVYNDTLTYDFKFRDPLQVPDIE